MSLWRVLVFLLSLLLCMGISSVQCKGNVRAGTPDGSEEWGYIEVRPKAHIFWWHYISPQRAGADWPIIMWLQGGPGASGTGIGNFQEVGALDTQLKPRNTTWLQKADLLFVDSPVGTGFSYVENDETLLSKTDAQVAADLLSFLKEFFKNSTLQESPIFIVGESYGGKPTSMLGLALSKAIEAGDIKVKLGGVLLGDSWISPVDYVLSWGPLLKDVSRLEPSDAENVNSIALKIKEQVRTGEYLDATASWSELEGVIDSASNSVDFYNFLLDSSSDPLSTITLQSMTRRSPQRYIQYLTSKQNIGQSGKNFDLSTFMNGVIRKKLQIIPSNIEWGEQSNAVFQALENDFMKSAVGVVDELLSRGEKVTIYNGQVDLICATIGTEAWVQQLKWRGLEGFNSTTRTPLYCNGTVTKGFVKSYKNLYFFWVLGAGHFIPVDNPCVALTILDTVVTSHSTNKST